MALAPVCFFVYARPDHAHQALTALAESDLAQESDLIVYADGARRPELNDRVAEVRRIVGAARGFRRVEVIERAENYGLSKSIIAGVSDACCRYGKAIVVEDDILVSPHFLRFMNDALAQYEGDDRVCSISGYMYPIPENLPDQLFLSHAECWGWATWARAWSAFEEDGAKLMREIKSRQLKHRMNLDGGYDFFQMLKDQVDGNVDSWAIRWIAVNLLLGRLTLYPGRSMTRNIGIDGSGQHASSTDVYHVEVAQTPLPIRSFPVEENATARREISRFLRKLKPSISRRIWRWLSNLFLVRKSKLSQRARRI